jgi:dipeptidyl aminopeptidase/acylaminoacyl peptidase
MRKTGLIVLCGWLLGAAQSPRVESVTPDDIVNLRQVTDPQVSPAGDAVAYVVETPVRAGEHKNAHIWLVPSDGSALGRPFIAGGLSDTSPRWSPDGSRIAFLSERPRSLYGQSHPSFHFKAIQAGDRKDLESKDTDPPAPQIWAIPLNGGEAVPLTDIHGGVKSFKWSKDGSAIAFVRKDQDTKEELDRKEKKEDQTVVDHDYKFDRLWIYKVSSQEAFPLTLDPLNIDDFDWSPDGLKLAARVSPTPVINDYWYVSKIVILDAHTGKIEKTLSDRAFWLDTRWSPSGDKICYSEQTAKGIVGIPMVYDLRSGEKKKLAMDFAGNAWAMEWNPDGNSLTAEAIAGTHALFAKLDVASGAAQKMTDVLAEGGGFTLSRDGRKIAYLGQALDHPTEVWTVADGTNRVLTNTNPQVDTWQLGKVQEVSWTNAKDKRRVYGVLVLPWHYEPGKPVKTIVQIHGGPLWSWWTGWLASWHEWAQMLASHGYAVLLPNPRGSDGQGLAFSEANYEDWGGGDFEDVLDGVDMLVQQKIADPEHLGIGGWSYGGFMTSWAITHTDRFRAAVIGAPVTDLFSMGTTTDIAPSFLTEYFGNFVENRKLYDEHSPMRYIDRCHTPALILHGDADTRVPTFQGDEFYHGLRFLGRETELVHYPREPHNVAERDHQRDLLQRVLDWYDSHMAK